MGRRLGQHDPFLGAQLVVVAAIALYLALPDRLAIGPIWIVPSVEGALAIALIAATPHPAMRYSVIRRRLAIGLTATVSAVNLISLGLLVHYLLVGGKAGGRRLILAGIVLWITNVLLFGLWYWELDRGGPVARMQHAEAVPDFLFPQMDKRELAPPGWRPGLIDYLYTSFTNATAFSPTDTMPLTATAKLLMAVQALASVLITALVVARAVNILT